MTGAVTFDNNSLQTFSAGTNTGIITSNIEHNNIPDKDVAIAALANANASVIPYVGFPSRKITIKGYIVGSTQDNLDSRIDTFKGYFTGKDKNLDIQYNAGTRRYIATPQSVPIVRQTKPLWAEFTIEFVCSQPFGRNTSVTNALSATGRTNSGYTDNHTFLGNAPFQLPVITITYTAISGGASFVQFTNNGNGQGILITDQTWVTNDVLEIDVVNKTVKKNGVEIDFLGAFPEFPPGAQSFSYSDGFTSRTMNEVVAYYPLWM